MPVAAALCGGLPHRRRGLSQKQYLTTSSCAKTRSLRACFRPGVELTSRYKPRPLTLSSDRHSFRDVPFFKPFASVPLLLLSSPCTCSSSSLTSREGPIGTICRSILADSVSSVAVAVAGLLPSTRISIIKYPERNERQHFRYGIQNTPITSRARTKRTQECMTQ